MHQRLLHAATPRPTPSTAVLDQLRRNGPTSRADIARSAGLSRATVSAVVADLLDSGTAVVVGAPAAEGGRVGRPPEQVALAPSASTVVGVDFQHHRVVVAALDAAHRLLGSASRDYPEATPWAARCRAAVEIVDRLLEEPGSGPLGAIGVGVHGATAPGTDVASGARAALADRYGVPVRADNNARLAGLAEWAWGAARGAQDLVYLRLATGVGGVVVLGGRVRRGPAGLGGELGHVCLDPAGPTCRCTRRGCLEAYAGLDVVLASSGTTGVTDLADAVDRGDARAQGALGELARRVAVVLAGVVTVLDVPLVVVGGDLAALGERLLVPVRRELVRHLLPGSADVVAVEGAALGDLDGALGGAALVLQDPTVQLAGLPAGAARAAAGERA